MKESIQILQACEDVQESRLVFGTWGNVSMILEDGNIIITPSGIPYDELREEDLVVCDRDGKVICGKQQPSSELKMHVAIYNTRQDVKAVVHTHSLYASIASSAFREVPLLTEDAAMVLGGKIEITNYKSPGTQGLADETVRCLRDVNAAIIANHGQVGVGPTLEDAIFAAVMCEKSCELYTKALSVSKNPRFLEDEEISDLRKIYVEHYRKLRDFKE